MNMALQNMAVGRNRAFGRYSNSDGAGNICRTITYWGILGDFLDFWDAFMWLVAFVFIELNIFQWQQGSRQSD